MPQKSKPIEALFIEFQCEKCGQGVFRVASPIPSESSPKQWLHRCTHCGDEVYFATAYPLIEYKGRHFMLEDYGRFDASNKPLP